MYATLAQTIYTHCECHKKVTRCFFQRGLYKNMISYCQEVNFTNKGTVTTAMVMDMIEFASYH